MADTANTRIWQSACGEAGDCVEVCFEGDSVLVRGSREPDGAVLSFTLQEWRAFTSGVLAGRFTG